MGCVHGKCSCWNGKESNAYSPSTSRGSKRQKGSNFLPEDKANAPTHLLGQLAEDESESETADQPTPLFSALEVDLGLPRLSRLSGQYLPPSGSRIAKVPAFDFELRYSYLSQRGYYPEALDKANQDSFCIHTQFGKDPNDHFFGVFDGHGEYGTQCSQFVKKHLCENLLKDRHFRSDAVQAYHAAFTATNAQLHRHNIDDSMSGTTGITILVRGKTLYVANVGDSRAVIAERRGKELFAVDLSSDQTPFRTDECARVKLCGARVLTLDQLEGLKNPNVQCWGGEDDDDGDPPRLWVANGMYPGTAFTRSIGDKIAEQIGVIAVPEVLVMELTSSHPFFVVASDGVFEFLSSQAVVDMVAKYKDPRDACAAVVAESYRLWLQYETRTDDITIIVVHVAGFQDTEGSLEAKPAEQLFEMENDNLSLPTIEWSQMPNRPVRHDISGARLRAIEASLHHSLTWEPPTESYLKTTEELVQIERALQGNFLFNNLTEKQRHILYTCMERLNVHAGAIVMRQGAEDDCFYIVESGEFEVLVSEAAASGGQDLGTVVNRYSADMFSCFGELALMYNKPRQASVRAVTDGSLWYLRREVFRGILAMQYSHESTLKMLRNIEVLSHLTLAQLHRLSDSLTEISFRRGDTLISKEDRLTAFYIIDQGEVQLTLHKEFGGTESESRDFPGESECQIKKKGSYFGEWVLLMGEPSCPVTAVAVTDVVCWVITKEELEAVVGPLNQIMHDDPKLRERLAHLRKEHAPEVDIHEFHNVKLLDLEWQNTVYYTDCCEVGLVVKKGSDTFVSMKRYVKQKVKQLGREVQVLREKSLIQSLNPSLFVPQVLHTCADEDYAAILLNTCLAGPLALVLHSPLDEQSTRFLASSVVVALDLLHKDGVVYRGISPDILMLDEKGQLQLVDFRFAKKLSDERNFTSDDRTFTICGMADFLAPEVIKGQGYGFAADWWAVGVLIYFMLHNDLPFGSWRDSELDVFARIAGGQLFLPATFSAEVTDLLNKLLMVDEEERLGYGKRGVDSIKQHPWFAGLDWEGLLECRVTVPSEILSRLNSFVEYHHAEDYQTHNGNATENVEDSSSTLWLDDW